MLFTHGTLSTSVELWQGEKMEAKQKKGMTTCKQAFSDKRKTLFIEDLRKEAASAPKQNILETVTNLQPKFSKKVLKGLKKHFYFTYSLGHIFIQKR